ncbi:protein silencing [Sparganum proliferum]
MGLYDVGSVRVRGEMDLSDSFTWTEYLEKTDGKPADWKCFKQQRTPPANLFEVDSLVEAVDQRSALAETPPPAVDSLSTTTAAAIVVAEAAFGAAATSTPRIIQESSAVSRRHPQSASVGGTLGPSRRSSAGGGGGGGGGGQVRRFRSATFTLARVIETSGPRIRVRLVGTDDRNDCWFLVDSDQIRPYPSGEPLQPPFGYVHNHLVWHKTLKKATEEGRFAPAACFITPPPDPEANYFKIGDKLEAVDRHNAQLICPATIGNVAGLHVLVSFDGWSGAFDYWTRFDSRDLFPVGWCRLANYPLQSPGPQAMRGLQLSSDPKPPQSAAIGAAAKRPSNMQSYRRSHSLGAAAKPRRQQQQRQKGKKLVRNSVRTLWKSAEAPRIKIVQPKPLSVGFESTTPLLKTVIKTASTFRNSPGADAGNHSPLRTSYTATPSAVAPISVSGDSSLKSFSSPPVIHPVGAEADDDDDGCGRRVLKGEGVELNAEEEEDDYGPPAIDAEPPADTGPPSLHFTPDNLDDAEEIGRRRKKSKKHKRHSSKEHKRYVADFQRSISAPEDYQPTKLVIRQRLGEADPTQSLFVDTVPYRRVSDVYDYHTHRHQPQQQHLVSKLSPGAAGDLALPASVRHIRMSDPTSGTGTGDTCAPRFLNVCPPRPLPGSLGDREAEEDGEEEEAHSTSSTAYSRSHNPVGDLHHGDYTSARMASSTASPSSMDLGPCPLPNPEAWTTDEVYNYLITKDPSLSDVAATFRFHEIDGQALLLLSMDSLRSFMKLKLGPSLKLDNLISRLKSGRL